MARLTVRFLVQHHRHSTSSSSPSSATSLAAIHSGPSARCWTGPALDRGQDAAPPWISTRCGGVRSVEIRLKQAPRAWFSPSRPSPDRSRVRQRVELLINGGTGPAAKAGRARGARRDGFWRPIRVDDKPWPPYPSPSTSPRPRSRSSQPRATGPRWRRARGRPSRGARAWAVAVGPLAFRAYPATAGLQSPRRHRRPPLGYEVGTPIRRRRQDEAGNTTTGTSPSSQGTAVQERRDRREGGLPGAQASRAPAPSAAGAIRATSSSSLSHRQTGPSQAGRGNQADAGGQDAAAAALDGVFLQPRNTKVSPTRGDAHVPLPRPPGRHPGPLRYDLAAVRHGPGPRPKRGRGRLRGPAIDLRNTVMWITAGPAALYAHLSTIEVRKAIGSAGADLGRTGTPGSPWAITCT